MIKKIAFAFGVFASASVAFAQVATDNYETGTIQYGYTGGTGFGALTYVEGTPGTVRGSNSTTDSRQIDGSQSLEIISGGGTQAAGRTINSPVTQGVFSLDVRWDISNGTNTFTGFNLASSLGNSLGTGELLSLGMTAANGNGSFLVTDAGGSRSLSVGTDTELRGGIFHFDITFNTTASTYSLTVTDKSNSQTGTISGSLNPGAFNAFKIANFDSEGNNTNGGSQHLIVDETTITAVPEPSTLSLLAGPAALGAIFFLRRRRA